ESRGASRATTGAGRSPWPRRTRSASYASATERETSHEISNFELDANVPAAAAATRAGVLESRGFVRLRNRRSRGARSFRNSTRAVGRGSRAGLLSRRPQLELPEALPERGPAVQHIRLRSRDSLRDALDEA